MMSKKSLMSYGIWAGISFGLWSLAWIVAESIPVFNDLLGLISAIFASWFTYGLSGIFWLHMNKRHYSDSKTRIFLTAVNSCIACCELFIVSDVSLSIGKK